MSNEDKLTWEHLDTPLLQAHALRDAVARMKPCPFCGDHPELIATMPSDIFRDLTDSHLGTHRVLEFIPTCAHSDCCGRSSKGWPTIEIAVAKWNDRAVCQEKSTEEPEFTREQLDQIDNVENSAHQLVCALCKDWDAPWNIEYIGEVADAAEAILKGKGLTTSYPAVVDGEDGIKIVE